MTIKSPTEGENRPLSEIRLEAGMDWAAKNAAAQLLEETKSAYVSHEIGKILAKNPSMALNRAEQLVKGDKNYVDRIEKQVEARRVANIARVQYDYWEAKQWERNNEEANHRAGSRL